MEGKLHSYESFATLDGPGIRFLIFLKGCPLRCLYCCNRDIVEEDENYRVASIEDIWKEVKNYIPYFGKDGGVTLSGGDPMFQAPFIIELLQFLKEKNIHTALDTSLFVSRAHLEKINESTDLFMVSLKHFDNEVHKQLTGQSNTMILENIRWLSNVNKETNKKIWFRFVVLPMVTDNTENLNALVSFLHEINFELIELIPYHTLGNYKWDKLGLKYQLSQFSTPTEERVLQIRDLLLNEGFNARVNFPYL